MSSQGYQDAQQLQSGMLPTPIPAYEYTSLGYTQGPPSQDYDVPNVTSVPMQNPELAFECARTSSVLAPNAMAEATLPATYGLVSPTYQTTLAYREGNVSSESLAPLNMSSLQSSLPLTGRRLPIPNLQIPSAPDPLRRGRGPTAVAGFHSNSWSGGPSSLPRRQSSIHDLANLSAGMPPATRTTDLTSPTPSPQDTASFGYVFPERSASLISSAPEIAPIPSYINGTVLPPFNPGGSLASRFTVLPPPNASALGPDDRAVSRTAAINTYSWRPAIHDSRSSGSASSDQDVSVSSGRYAPVAQQHQIKQVTAMDTSRRESLPVHQIVPRRSSENSWDRGHK